MERDIIIKHLYKVLVAGRKDTNPEETRALTEAISILKQHSEVVWNYNTKPDKPDVYWVVLIYDEYKDYKPTGRTLAMVCSRYLADAEKEPEELGWKMKGEPDTGLVWISETGSPESERVYAWTEYTEPEFDTSTLPEGVIYEC